MTPPIAMLNPETAAPILDCSPDTVAELLNTGELPSQAEAHLMAANIKELMAKDWYWTSTQYSDSLAWYQVFNYGNQDSYYKGAEARARAVRLIHLSA